jgi:fatty-acyl-CoA synthase
MVVPDRGSAFARDAWTRALQMTAPIADNPGVTLPDVVEALAGKFGDRPALMSEQQCLTYRELAGRSNQYARWAKSKGLRAGDVVGLMMPNCPEYMAIWLGVTRIGGIAALLNTNLSGESLAHSINAAGPKHIIVGSELADSLAALLPRLTPGVRSWVHGESRQDIPRIDDQVRLVADDRLDRPDFEPPSIADCALYIYTSGTTGLPKAAKVSHFRLMQWSYWFAGMMDTGPGDRMYDCLPMYHSVGGLIATGATLVNGGAVILRRQFSASRFWDDIVESKCTLFQYIGELCRYLVNSPSHPKETKHHLRLCCGNGLRLDIWERFKNRFCIPRILEFYAATEGTFSLYNCEGKPGAIGRIPSFLAHRYPVALVKHDIETGMPLRGTDDFCIRCSGNEAGEAIGKIPAGRLSVNGFEGYNDRDATDSKILRNVFVNGDAWYRTGDLMRRDDGGYFYFIDRVGDTFRWKGENVSTAEVTEAISACRGVVGAVVYGVGVPGTEGRAGMAAVVVNDAFDLVSFRHSMVQRLPEYARPLFLRVRDEIETTATFKPKKQKLQAEGYDPGVITDDIYFDDRVSDAFVKLDAELYDLILSGNVRL